METMEKAPRLTNKEDNGAGPLDANLWGQLQEHIPLQTIYEKFLQQDLFRLRIVSKEWNQAALQWMLPEPSYVIISAVVGSSILGWDVGVLKGIVMYNNASSKFGCQFKFDHQRFYLPNVVAHVPPFEVEGLILCYHPYDLMKRAVLNVHNRTWHTIPASPIQSDTLSTCGLLVDTTLKPYAFKLIEGNSNFKTQIYDSKSKSWSIKSSRLPSLTTRSWLDTLEYSCMSNNGNVYISEGTQTIWKYSLKDDKWTKFKPLEVRNCVKYPALENTFGVWAGRIFIMREDHIKKRVTVWELVNSEGQEWVEYACMPKNQYRRLLKCETDDYFLADLVYLKSFFCNNYLLVCCRRWMRGCMNVPALFNLATKTWLKVDLHK